MNDEFLTLSAPRERPTFTIDLPPAGESRGFELEIRDQDCNRILWLVVEPARPAHFAASPRSLTPEPSLPTRKPR